MQKSSPASGVARALPANGVVLHPGEWLMLALVAALGVATLALTLTMRRQVDWQSFLLGIAASLMLVAVGAYARKAKSARRLGAVAIGLGIFMGFTAFSSIFIFALFPLHNPLIDLTLIRADAALGYDWPAFVEGLAAYPAIARPLGVLYVTSVPQIALTIILLGALQRETALQRFLLVGILSLCAAVAIWWVWPSIGPSAYKTVATEAKDRIGLVVDAAYGDFLLGLVERGPGVIRPEVIAGVVAFPSYHIIMACMVAWYTFRTFAFVPAAFAGIGMVPATLSHGGHHLVDIIAGIVLFLATVWVAARLVPDPDEPT